MTQKESRTVLGPVFKSTQVVEADIDELHPVVQPEPPSAGHARMLSWLDRDARRNPARSRRRILEIVSMDGRSLMSVDFE